MQFSDTFAQKTLSGERGVNVETGFLTNHQCEFIDRFSKSSHSNLQLFLL